MGNKICVSFFFIFGLQINAVFLHMQTFKFVDVDLDMDNICSIFATLLRLTFVALDKNIAFASFHWRNAESSGNAALYVCKAAWDSTNITTHGIYILYDSYIFMGRMWAFIVTISAISTPLDFELLNTCIFNLRFSSIIRRGCAYGIPQSISAYCSNCNWLVCSKTMIEKKNEIIHHRDLYRPFLLIIFIKQ